MRRLITVFTLLFVASSLAFAQRTVPGDGAVTVAPVFTGTSYGVHAGWTQWTLWGGWDAGAAFRDYGETAAQDVTLQYSHVVLEADAMFRLLSARSRCICLYGGAGAFIGVELTDPFRKLPEWVSISPGTSFLYGIQAVAAIDFYILKRLSVGIRAAAPISFSSDYDWFHWEAGLTIRFDI